MALFADLKTFIAEQEKQTGLKISVYDENGKVVIGEKKLDAPISISEITVDEKNGQTFFPLSFAGENYIVGLDGANEERKVNAYLLKSLAENSFSIDNDFGREEFFTRLLFGEIGYAGYRRFAEKFSVAEMPCFVMLITVKDEKLEDVIDVLSNYGNAKTDCIIKLKKGECAFIKVVDSETEDYRSATEYAEYLSRSVYEETGEEIAISIGGTAKNPFELSSSYSQAVATTRMGETVGINGGVHSFKEYVLVKILEDMPKYKLNEYLAILAQDQAAEIFNDKEMTQTAEVFLENNLNVSETARILYLHRNTLTYRLDKIEKHTGLNVRKFADAVTFRLITILLNLVK